MALIWAKMTTGMPFKIVSALVGQRFCSEYTLDMDIHRNEPNVLAAAVCLSGLDICTGSSIQHRTKPFNCRVVVNLVTWPPYHWMCFCCRCWVIRRVGMVPSLI